jgi:hypothetical protein
LVSSLMSKTFIRTGGVWRQVSGVWVRQSGVWTRVSNEFIRVDGSYKSVFSVSGGSGSVVFGDTTVNRNDASRSGAAYSWVVPTGVTSVSVNASGGGGGAYAYHDGGYCQHAWAGGPGGGVQSLVIPVTAGDVISGVYGNGGGSSSYNGVRGGDGSATTILKNGGLVATCGAGGNATDARPPTPGTTTITPGYSGIATTGTSQTNWVSGCDGGYPPQDHYDPWSWVFGGDPGYPQSVLGTVAVQAPSILGTDFGRAGMPQVCGWVSITW